MVLAAHRVGKLVYAAFHLIQVQDAHLAPPGMPDDPELGPGRGDKTQQAKPQGQDEGTDPGFQEGFSQPCQWKARKHLGINLTSLRLLANFTMDYPA